MTYLVGEGISRSRACDLSGYSRSLLYYRHRKRSIPLDPSIESRISEIIKERPSYGTRRVTAMIRRSRLNVNRKRVRRHMRAMNLVMARKKVAREKAPRAVVVSTLNRTWETDFTKIYIPGEGWVYFTAYIDLCSRKVRGFLVSMMSRTEEMLLALDSALLTEFPDLVIPNLSIRSDDGSQLTSHRYEEYLRSLGIRHETIHPNTPEEDGHVESYFGHFKEDYIYTRDFSSYIEFESYIGWAVNDYNSVRPHSSLDYLTPEEFECRIMEDEMFRRKWIEKQMGRYEHVILLE
ncbi:IS3 family transposase [Cuniculiplasma divulgatum]|uniref:IS3 family transposase OrfB n=1 Tax=Cuniculiplasma divulgatum TaxID=1673428 RepID=A0A1N5WIX8_9ARCH|nr:IS3 family transposase [Cuniculiplasma divulgatum]SIM84430.1 IS3 family transposase OrfB [Cuniculiplasma divulgatum]